LAATVNATVPLPVPEVPDVSVIHAAPSDAVHAQVLAEAVTANEPEPPGSPTFCEVGEMEKVQAGGGGGGGGAAAAACEIVNVFPAMAMVAVRASPLLADTR
jgi:hypothetical protein